jgi:hypothetical protein
MKRPGQMDPRDKISCGCISIFVVGVVVALVVVFFGKEDNRQSPSISPQFDTRGAEEGYRQSPSTSPQLDAPGMAMIVFIGAENVAFAKEGIKATVTGSVSSDGWALIDVTGDEFGNEPISSLKDLAALLIKLNLKQVRPVGVVVMIRNPLRLILTATTTATGEIEFEVN